MDSWISKQYAELQRIGEDGASPSGVLAPFHDALVPGIRGLGERGFSTALGNLHERIGVVVAQPVHASARRAFDLTGELPVLAREFITQRVAQLELQNSKPDHPYERDQLLTAFGVRVPASVRIDLIVTTHDGEEHLFEMKSPKPNKGQCAEMKHRLLTAFAIRRRESVHVCWGVPYNPYGTSEAYAHPYPLHMFDFGYEVKLGPELWNFLGNDPATYEQLLDLYREVGADYIQALDSLREALAGREA